ncbi:MAG TPA: hypothetical protein VLI41_03220 [Phenylobacterium sp.]|uniref:hypothetical protein n=1 Tax=Phenylobacterium sp. TaxID=1871053 RepID=UPI002B5906CD|nr:hypothetical protein [Phenylobacterium sp.]HSV02194.1 hypothetical protein [Phenylobacterium sp.]
MARSKPRDPNTLPLALAALVVILLILIAGIVWLRRGTEQVAVPLPRPPLTSAPHLPNAPPLPQRPHLPVPIPTPK